jgi:hypothetical protein
MAWVEAPIAMAEAAMAEAAAGSETRPVGLEGDVALAVDFEDVIPEVVHGVEVDPLHT